MLSRIAESLYWMCAYIERAENTVRMIQVNLNLILDVYEDKREAQWKPLMLISGDEERFFSEYEKVNRENVIKFLTFDDENPNSIYSCIYAARQSAKGMRDVLSFALWEQIDQLYKFLKKTPYTKDLDFLSFYDQIIDFSYQILGTSYATIARDSTWKFMQYGRYLERADMALRLIDVKYYILLPSTESVSSTYNYAQWRSLLKSCSALEMYSKHYHRTSPEYVMAFLLRDAHFPRSVAYCLNTVLNSADRNPVDKVADKPIVDEINATLEMIDQLEINSAFFSRFHDDIDILQTCIGNIVSLINLNYFHQELTSESSESI